MPDGRRHMRLLRGCRCPYHNPFETQNQLNRGGDNGERQLFKLLRSAHCIDEPRTLQCLWTGADVHVVIDLAVDLARAHSLKEGLPSELLLEERTAVDSMLPKDLDIRPGVATSHALMLEKNCKPCRKIESAQRRTFYQYFAGYIAFLSSDLKRHGRRASLFSLHTEQHLFSHKTRTSIHAAHYNTISNDPWTSPGYT